MMVALLLFIKTATLDFGLWRWSSHDKAEGKLTWTLDLRGKFVVEARWLVQIKGALFTGADVQ